MTKQKSPETKEYLEQVFLVKAQIRDFNWKMPHQPLDQKEVCGTAFRLFYKNKTSFITCFHVIDNAFHITIVSPLNGSKEFVCRVQWICPQLDIAVLVPCDSEHTIEKGRGLSPWIFPHTYKHKIPGPPIGAVAYTIGFPLGQTHLKITKGIVSGQQCGLFQTDAPINPGNSGGPLVWEDKILGVNSSGFVLAQNVGYAIPITRVLQLIDYHSKHPTLFLLRFPRHWGMTFAPPSTLISSSRHDETKECGLYVTKVFRHQFMHTSSIRPGDTILRVNNIRISSLGEMSIQWMNQNINFSNYFHHIALGQRVKIDYLSKNKLMTDIIVVEPESQHIFYRQWNAEHETIPYIYFCGLVIVPFCVNIMSARYVYLKVFENISAMTENPILIKTKDADDPMILEYMQPEHWDKGRLFISNILKGSIAEKRHLIKIGDIVKKINNTSVSTIPHAMRVLQHAMRQNKDIRIEMFSGSLFSITPAMVRHEETRLTPIYKYTSTFLSTASK